MIRAVVSVATTDHTRKGIERIYKSASLLGSVDLRLRTELPPSSPTHADVPYAFKAFALNDARKCGAETLLWCDACILPVRPLEPAWQKIERDGYLLMNNGFSNYEWTADSAYPDLFPGQFTDNCDGDMMIFDIDAAHEINRDIPHTVGGFFGLSMRHEIGRAFLAELYRLASETRAFCGPWINSAFAELPSPFDVSNEAIKRGYIGVCGPPDVRGHRHDQTAMSVIAWRLGMKLSDAPSFFVYGKAQDAQDDRTLVVADGSYA